MVPLGERDWGRDLVEFQDMVKTVTDDWDRSPESQDLRVAVRSSRGPGFLGLGIVIYLLWLLPLTNMCFLYYHDWDPSVTDENCTIVELYE